ncbi:MAG: ATP-binding cassette domain-containing protein [Rhodospirillaceae bacterium]|nr:ATP-binding cassette domain-containing protein [Rhodospirillaceae bacterium]
MSSATILPLLLQGVGYAVDGRPLIEGVSFRFEAGPRTIVLGPNGAGKSLLLRLCHGLIKPTAGRVVWAGTAAAHAGQRQAMVFQRPLMLRRSALANVAYPLKLRGVPAAERHERAQAALARTGLAALADRPARHLSIGEQQRLALARAWVCEPEVLFLDEPTASLDPASTFAVEEIVQAIHAAGTKIIMTTHDLGQARRLADEVVFLHRGQILEHQAAPDFFARPATVEARAFLAGTLRW